MIKLYSIGLSFPLSWKLWNSYKSCDAFNPRREPQGRAGRRLAPRGPVRKHGAGTAGSAERTRPYVLEWVLRLNEVLIRKCLDRKNALIPVTINALDNEGGMGSF